MNPFTESTVALPWAEKACSKFAGAARVARAGRRRRMLSALGVLASGVALHGMALAIDVNAATPEQLREIRGIGPKMRSEEHTSELQSLMRISYAVFCLKKKKTQITIKSVSLSP